MTPPRTAAVYPPEPSGARPQTLQTMKGGPRVYQTHARAAAVQGGAR